MDDAHGTQRLDERQLRVEPMNSSYPASRVSSWICCSRRSPRQHHPEILDGGAGATIVETNRGRHATGCCRVAVPAGRCAPHPGSWRRIRAGSARPAPRRRTWPARSATTRRRQQLTRLVQHGSTSSGNRVMGIHGWLRRRGCDRGNAPPTPAGSRLSTSNWRPHACQMANGSPDAPAGSRRQSNGSGDRDLKLPQGGRQTCSSRIWAAPATGAVELHHGSDGRSSS